MERRLPLALKSLALRSNAHELWEMKRFVEDDLRLEFRFDAMVNPRIDPSPGPLAFRLTPEEVVYCKRCVTSNQRAQSRREHEVDAADNTVDTLIIDV
jgi:hypothetical protein